MRRTRSSKVLAAGSVGVTPATESSANSGVAVGSDVVGTNHPLTTIRHHSCSSWRALLAIAGIRKNCDEPDGRA